MVVQNKKVRNATPTILDGIKFRSKLEAYTYKALKEAEIPFEYEKTKFILQPAFEFQGKKHRAITLMPDFIGTNFIIECKGHPNDAFPMKWKMFLYHLKEKDMEHQCQLFIVHNQKEVNEVLKQIQNDSI